MDEVDSEYVKMSKDAVDDNNKEDDEWLNYNYNDANLNNAHTSSEARQWASAAIARISNEHVEVETALGALGLVLHSGSSRSRCVAGMICELWKGAEQQYEQ